MSWKQRLKETKAFKDLADRELSEIEAFELLEMWMDEVESGEDPEQSLMEICGLEPDYFDELIDFV